ncbi:MAG: NAD(P)-dependent alcohol dehydrogenase [Anaerolineales bacterium]|nr:NAD(P)-dependent alcohol dehydrogenase [Anaerolineales bacterium]
MKAITYTKYGSPDVLQLKEVAKPTPKDNELLIRIEATTVTAVDSIFRQGSSLSGRFFTGLARPKRPVLGSTLAGEVEAVGKDVTLFKEGDQVFGATADFGAHAEYICLPEDGALALKPASISYEEAVATNGILTALPFLRDTGQIQSGQKILINGASGSVGSYAVQLAKQMGAEVTGVCSTEKMEFVKSLGADKVIDYKKEDFTDSGETYDIIFDAAGKSSYGHSKHALKENGVYLSTVLSAGIVLDVLRTSLMGSKKAKIAFTGLRPASEKAKDLRFLIELMEAGQLKSLIDRSYPLAQTAEAHRYVDTGRKKGSIVITVA